MNTISAYSVKWYCFKIGSKKNAPKYSTKGTFAMVIGNVVLTHSKTDAARIRKNISNTKCEPVHEFVITDKQFGLINLTQKDYSGWTIEEVEALKKCKMPHLVVNNNGRLAIIPVTNRQFIGTASLNRKSVWL